MAHAFNVAINFTYRNGEKATVARIVKDSLRGVHQLQIFTGPSIAEIHEHTDLWSLRETLASMQVHAGRNTRHVAVYS